MRYPIGWRAPPPSGNGPLQQRGVALLLLAALTAMIAFVLLNGFTQWTSSVQRERRSAEALARAKEALLAHIATNALSQAGMFPGYLPCPEDTGGAIPEGSETGNCGTTNVSVMGRLPWRTLGLPPPRDAASECLWYAVSGYYKRSFISAPLDIDGVFRNGDFEIVAPDGITLLAGSSPDNRAVAVIFAPGNPAGTQTHTPARANMLCPGNYTAANYLDRDIAASPIIDPNSGAAIDNARVATAPGGISRYLPGPLSGRGINDQMVFITKDEVYAAMVPALRELTRRAASCFAHFAANNNAYPSDRRMPWATNLDLHNDPGGNYADPCLYEDDSDYLTGRMTYEVGTSGTQVNNNLFSYNATCSISPTAPPPENRLLRSNSSCPGWSELYHLWDRWKSLIFYAVAEDFEPDAGSTTPDPCPDCLQVNGTGQYAAIVLFGGRQLAGQLRDADSRRADADNYLEGRNPNWIEDRDSPQDPSKRNYETRPAAADFNDILYCIKPDLTVEPCP